MVTMFFLELNACYFQIPDDAPDFTRDLAARTLDSQNHTLTVEINRVADWLRQYVRRPFWSRVTYAQRVRKSRKIEGDIYITQDIMSTSDILLWGIEKAYAIAKFVPGIDRLWLHDRLFPMLLRIG
jgi:hypothetical protein